MASNQQRREAYRFYRSLGYSPQQAAKMRNRGRQRLVSEYRGAAREYNDKRVVMYAKDEDILKPKDRPKKPYRPEIKISDHELNPYENSLRGNYNVPSNVVDQMLEPHDFFDIEIYSERVEKLADFFNSKGLEWNELMEMLAEMHYDLGDWFDALGEMYDEHNN